MISSWLLPNSVGCRGSAGRTRRAGSGTRCPTGRTGALTPGREGSELGAPASAPGEGIPTFSHNSFLEASWFLENTWQAGLAA